MIGPWRTITFLIALGAIWVTPCFSQATDGTELAKGARKQPEAAAENAAKARQIDELITGRLDAAVDPASLFNLKFDGDDALRAQTVLKLVSDRSFYAAARSDTAALAPLSAADASLALAQARFLRLPERERSALLAAQARRVEQSRAQASAREAKTQELNGLNVIRQRIEAFLAGAAPPGLDEPLSLLRIAADITPADRRDGAVPDSEPGPEASIDDRIAWSRAQLRSSLNRLLSLPSDRLRVLEAAARAADVDRASLDAAEAALTSANQQLDAAQKVPVSKSLETSRLIVGERAKLVATAAAQARAKTLIAQLEQASASVQDTALAWRRRVADIAAHRDAAPEADRAYDALVDDLKRIRRDLSRALDRSRLLSGSDIEPPALDPALPSGSPATARLEEQRRSLLTDAQELEAAFSAALWSQRATLRDAMVAVNGERLALIPMLGRDKRNAVLGFGREGVSQVQREFSQIALDLRFHLQGWRNVLSSSSELILRPSPELVLGVLRLLVIALAFRWWRAAGDGVLVRTQQSLEARRPKTLLSAAQATIVTRWREVRRPLDWLVFAALVRWLLPADLEFAGLQLIWIVVLWSLVTVLLVRLADALAGSGSADDPRASLRWNSLRLFAGTLLGVGLVLGLTAASVGKGAIYNWVLAFCWLLAPALLLLLAHWWRDRIVALSAGGSGDSALLGWIARDPGGVPGLLGRVAAGAVLMISGAQAVIGRRARDLALVRELFEQRSRALAAQKVAEDKASGRFHRPPDDVLAALDPHRLPIQARPDGARPGGLTLPHLAAGMVTAIIGERGLGKSAILRDLAGVASSEGKTIELRVDARGMDGLIEDLAEALGLGPRSRSPDHVAKALPRQKDVALFAIDDVQRLAVPAIGGLASLDRLVELARQCRGSGAWVLSIGGPAWSYISRARFERSLFDTIIRLPRWSTDELRYLIERRTEQAGVVPDFSDIVDEGTFRFSGELTAEERRKRGYFERLADYAHGNPAIALEYWRRSLFVDSLTGSVTVRTFATPDVARLHALPAPAMFVLRAILQMDLADVDEILHSTDLPADVVADALRRLEYIGVIACTDDCYRVTLFWWTEAVRLLERQNLLIRWAA